MKYEKRRNEKISQKMCVMERRKEVKGGSEVDMGEGMKKKQEKMKIIQEENLAGKKRKDK